MSRDDAHPTVDDLAALLDQHGARPERWPDGAREDALELTRSDDGAQGLWRDAVALDDALDSWTVADAPVDLAARIAAGPNFGHMMTKTMLAQEWSMSIEQAIEAEAQAQAICMQTADFERAYKAFTAKERPVFEGN